MNEVVSPEGLRQDGRRVHESRLIRAQLGELAHVDGSARVEQGHTQVVVSVQGPREMSVRSQALHDRALVTCSYSVASFAASQRKESSKGSRHSKELALIVRQTFESVIQTDLYPRSEICIAIDVLQADCDAVCPAINATTLALINAGIPMKSFVTACSAGYMDKKTLLDLNYQERQRNGGCLSVAVEQGEDRKICMARMESKLPLDQLDDVLELASTGCAQIHTQLKAVVEQHSLGMLHTRGILSS